MSTLWFPLVNFFWFEDDWSRFLLPSNQLEATDPAFRWELGDSQRRKIHHPSNPPEPEHQMTRAITARRNQLN